MFHSNGVTDLFPHLHIRFPDIPCYGLYMIPALGTLCKIRAVCADCPAALVFPVSLPVRGAAGQQFMLWTEICENQTAQTVGNLLPVLF